MEGVPVGVDSRTNGALDFDSEALRAKYRRERDKRLRQDGIGQYTAVRGDLAHFLDDPYAGAVAERAPLTDEVEVLVVGGGFGGLLAGARLRQAGVQDVRIIDKAGDFGGTWYWNRYPGAACDIESYVYLPLLEETGFVPTQKYAAGREILDYSRQLARHFDLDRSAILHTEVTDLRWDEQALRWFVSTNRGDALRARFVVMSAGPLHRPKLPGIPGLTEFKGHSFHTSRWDYAYTGGDQSGELTGLRDKRVGIIGTGATAVQCVPYLGEWAERLYVFQRTPSSIDVRNNRPTEAAWASGLQPGWHQSRMDNFNILVSGGHQDEDLVADGWTDIIRSLGALVRARATSSTGGSGAAELVQLADFQKMEQVRARVDQIVSDPATAEALKPYYNQFCKRPCFHDEYLQIFNRSNVMLVDTQGQGVERITANGVVVGGTEYALDCLIFATGFEVSTGYTQRAGLNLTGRDGVGLMETWGDGMLSLHGLHAPGFPNCFILGTSQAGFTASYPHALNEQSKHVAYVVTETQRSGAATAEATKTAALAWRQTILDLAVDRRKFLEECTPGYYNSEGKISPLAASYAPYGAGSLAYFQVLENWRCRGDMQGMTLHDQASSRAAGEAKARGSSPTREPRNF